MHCETGLLLWQWALVIGGSMGVGVFIAYYANTYAPDPPADASLEKWITANFAGHGAAVRREDDPPIPGEPLMPMADAKELVRKAVAYFTAANF